jgi:hypothetical protein
LALLAMAEMNGTCSDESGVIQEGEGAEGVTGGVSMSAHVPVPNSPIRKGWAGDRKTGHGVDASDGGDTNGTTSWNFKVGLYESMTSDVASCPYNSHSHARMHSLARSLPPSLSLPSLFLSLHTRTNSGGIERISDSLGRISAGLVTYAHDEFQQPQKAATSCAFVLFFPG